MIAFMIPCGTFLKLTSCTTEPKDDEEDDATLDDEFGDDDVVTIIATRSCWSYARRVVAWVFIVISVPIMILLTGNAIRNVVHSSP